MKSRFENFFIDYYIIGTIIILVIIGLLCLYSATSGNNQSLLKTDFGKQIIWFIIGFLVFMFFFFLPLRVWSQSSYIFYGISLIFLVMVFFSGFSGIHRWIVLGPFRFQPSELAKVTTLLALARYFSQQKENTVGWKKFSIAVCIGGVPLLLVLKEPDLGTALVFFVMLIVMVIWAGLQWKFLLWALIPFATFASGFNVFSFASVMIVLVALLVATKQKWWIVLGVGGLCFALGFFAPALWGKLEPYQQERMLIFLGMKSDPHGAAYQLIQSKIAVGSGGILGKGFLHGSQTQLRFLPEQHTDFIFSVLGEEFGFVGITTVLSLFLILFLRMLFLAKTTRDEFASFILIGGVAILSFQAVVNIGMTIGLFPITGLPLPFLSYGGSSLLMSMSLVGLAANISARRYRY